MNAQFKVGDRVRRIEGDTEIGIITLIDGGNALVDFDRFTKVVQYFIQLSDLEVVTSAAGSSSRVRFVFGLPLPEFSCLTPARN